LEENSHATIEEYERNIESLKNQLKGTESGKKNEGLTRKKVEQPSRWERDHYESDSRDDTYTTNTTIEHIKEDYEKELNRLREQLRSAEKERYQGGGSQRVIDNLQYELDTLKRENESIISENNKLKEKIKFREQSMLTEFASFKKRMDEQNIQLSSELELAKRSVEMKEAKINELSQEIKSLSAQIQGFKNQGDQLTRRTFSISSPSSKFDSKEVEQLRASESSLRKQNSELREENQRLKKEVELIQEYANVIQCDENTLNELTKENEELRKKVKELTKAQGMSSPNGSDNEDSKRTLKELQRNYMRTQETLSTTKVCLLLEKGI